MIAMVGSDQLELGSVGSEPNIAGPEDDLRHFGRQRSPTRHFERDPISYALETDWPVGAAGFEPLHIRIGICQDSQPGGRDSNLRISN
jgi:hypothetical protein